ncbi:fimbria/pilus outer membrane usher protein [Tsuneonella amylolytica]|uniref:fimbria/pilus outer membrane usher protein n=1 Tax=Tsuneonella amylolytica TaxID=2338327 RepID=UPI000EAA3D97|nr:fimbria/pilus outer membrane usher protein [Tsuneonella amylolytica]
MSSPRPCAARHLLALIAATGAAFLGPPARAQDDPFALPKDLTVQSVALSEAAPGLSEIVVDGRARARMVSLSGTGDDIAIDAGDARAAGLPVPQGVQGPVKLSDLKVYEWRFDKLRQTLSVALFRKSDGGNFRDLTAQERREGQSSPLLALRIDYDLNAAWSPGDSVLGGFAEATLVRGNLAAFTSLRATTSPGPRSDAILRLDSAIRWAGEQKGIIATAGDFVSAGSQSQRAVRMGGLQIASDFDLRPDLVTIPLPAFSGQVAVPTTLDIVGADRRYEVGKIEPGEFTVRNIPVAPGRGELSVVLRDTLGRETIQTARFYNSRDLLAPTTTGYAVNAGFVRRRYGERSNDYGQLAASAYVRRGISSVLTVEGSGEWTAGLLNAGVRADFVVGGFAKAMVEARYSRDGGATSGTLLSATVESVGPRLALAAGAVVPSAGYRDVATKLGDPVLNRRYFANASYRLGAQAQAQLSFVREESRADRFRLSRPRQTNSARANFETQVSNRLRMYTSAGYRWGSGERDFAASIGLSFNIGPERHAAAFVTHNGGRTSGGATFQKDDLREGDFGYRATASLSENTHRLGGELSWRQRGFRLVGQAEEVNGQIAARANMRGSLIVAGGGVFARNTAGSSLALVRTGEVGGVPITYENRLVGYTDKNGRLLIQNVAAQAGVRIDVDADKLPVDALVRSTEKIIRVARRSVALVQIDAVRFVPVLRALVDPTGNALPAGLPVRAQPSGDLGLTGFDGMVELNAGAREKRLIVGRPGSACVVELAGIDLEKDDAAPLVCTPRAIAAEGDASYTAVEGSRAKDRSRGDRRRAPAIAARN